MKQKTQSIYSYFAIFDPAEEGGYNVSFPDFPGFVTFGRTFEEAKAHEVLELWLEELSAEKQDIPQHSSRPINVGTTLTYSRTFRHFPVLPEHLGKSSPSFYYSIANNFKELSPNNSGESSGRYRIPAVSIFNVRRREVDSASHIYRKTFKNIFCELLTPLHACSKLSFEQLKWEIEFGRETCVVQTSRSLLFCIRMKFLHFLSFCIRGLSLQHWGDFFRLQVRFSIFGKSHFQEEERLPKKHNSQPETAIIHFI